MQIPKCDCGRFGMVGAEEYRRILDYRPGEVRDILALDPTKVPSVPRFVPGVRRESDPAIDPKTRNDNTVRAIVASISHDYETAWRLAMAGDLDDGILCGTIGRMFLHGNGVEQSDLEAFYWFLRGYLNDDSLSALHLAEMYGEYKVTDTMEALCGVQALLPPVLFTRIAPPGANILDIVPETDVADGFRSSLDDLRPDGGKVYAAELAFADCSAQKAAYYLYAHVAFADESDEVEETLSRCRSDACGIGRDMTELLLAEIYRHGCGNVDKDAYEAERHERNVSSHCECRKLGEYLYGMALYNGIGVRQDRAAAIPYIQSAAFGGILMAQRYARHLASQGFVIYASRMEQLSDGKEAKEERVVNRIMDELVNGSRGSASATEDEDDDEPLGFFGWLFAIGYLAFIVAKYALFAWLIWIAWKIFASVAGFFFGGIL